MDLIRSTAVALVAVLSLPAALRGADCPAGAAAVAPHLQREELERTLSWSAELVASSAGGRQRAVGKPLRPRSTLPIANFIDTHIVAKMEKGGVEPTTIAGDEEFVRRVSLDLTGAIPTAAEVTAFVADPAADKRAKAVDRLLKSDAFVDRWTMWLGDLVQNTQFAANVGVIAFQARNTYHAWIRNSIRDARPYDQMVRELLSAEGFTIGSNGGAGNGAAGYVVRQIQANGPPQDTLDNLATHSFEKFMGMPVLCISCHNGAFHLEQVNWYLRNKTREDFWRTAAFFAQTTIRRQGFVDPKMPVVGTILQHNIGTNPTGAYLLNTVDGNKSPRQPAAGQPMAVAPAFLTTGEQPRAGETYRAAYGRMLTADRQFARATANYLWKEMFGLGLVEPPASFDLARLNEQCSHPALLEALTDEVIAKNYSLREVLRTIVSSSTYQLSARYTPTVWNEEWTSYYARHYPRRMHSEVLVDAIGTATGVPADIFVRDMGVLNAMQLPDPWEGNRFLPYWRVLTTFGRGNRDDVVRTNESSITQALTMLNDTYVLSRVKRSTPGSTVALVLAATSDPGAVADQIYLATLSRRPTASERAVAVEYLGAGPLDERTEDLQFALLNTLEFIFQ